MFFFFGTNESKQKNKETDGENTMSRGFANAGDKLSGQMNRWLGKVEDTSMLGARAIISPHAGFSYSGPTAAFAFKQVQQERARRRGGVW